MSIFLQSSPFETEGQFRLRTDENFRKLELLLSRLPLSGEGSPEGITIAPIGRLYTRTDGGASTTLYVKESGTGNTGWVAK